MKVLNQELDLNITDNSAKEFRDDVVKELEKLIKEPFAMNNYTESKLVGEQKCLKEIIEYLNNVI